MEYLIIMLVLIAGIILLIIGITKEEAELIVPGIMIASMAGGLILSE